MKNKRFIIILVITILLVAGVALISMRKKTDGVRFKEEYEALNGSSSVTININANNPIKYVSFDELIEILTNGTGVIYFGFPGCPWCRNALPVLFEVAAANKCKTIYYFNPRNISDDDDKRRQLIETLSDYLLEDDGEKVLYVPDIYFVKEGEVMGHHISTVDSQLDPAIKLTNEQRQELYNIYQQLFDKMK